MESARITTNKPTLNEPPSYAAMNKAFKAYYGTLSNIKTHKHTNSLNKTEEAFNIISKPLSKKVNESDTYSARKIANKSQISSPLTSPRKDSRSNKRGFRSGNSSMITEEKVSHSVDAKRTDTKSQFSLTHAKSVPRREKPEPIEEEKKEKKEDIKRKSPKGTKAMKAMKLTLRPWTAKSKPTVEKPVIEEKKPVLEEKKASYSKILPQKVVKQADLTVTAADKRKIAVYFRYRKCTLTRLIEEKIFGKNTVVKSDRPGFTGWKPVPGAAKPTSTNMVEEAWSLLKAKASARSKFKYKGITNYSKTIRDLIKTVLPAESVQSPKKPLNISLSDKDPSKKKTKKPKSPKEELVTAFNESIHTSSRKVFIVSGGYGRIKKALRDRGWIENPDKTSKNFDLKWGSRTDMEFWSLQPHQLVNHCEKSISLTSKVELAWNMRNLIWHGEDIDSYYPRCYDLSDLNELEDFLEDFKFEQAVSVIKLAKNNSEKKASENHNGLLMMKLCVALGYCERRMKDLEGVVSGVLKSEKQSMAQEEWEVLNASSLKSIQDDVKYASLVDGVKKCYQVNFESDSVEMMEELVNGTEKMIAKLEESFPQVAMNQGKNAWIVKPAGLSRGRGISCHNTLGNILEHVKMRGSDWIAQKYIENPLIIKNRKFDIRQWVLVTDWNPLTIWFYDECYLRFTAHDYNSDDFENKFAHLTNNAVAKHASNFDKSTIEGNMWDSNQLRDHLQETTGRNVFDETIKPQLKNIIIKSLQCSKDTPELYKNTFELYGYDFMVDQDFKTWLIEINSSPCMEYSTKVTERLVKMVLEDCVKVVVDYGMADPQDRKGISTGSFKKIFKEKKGDGSKNNWIAKIC